MTLSSLPVTEMFLDLVRHGYITPPTHMEEMRFPGELLSTPSTTEYGTPDMPIRIGVHGHAELAQRSERNFDRSGNRE